MYEYFLNCQNISQLFLIFLYLCERLRQNYLIMDIDLLSKMVKELILDNDRVVLPGLGCFVAEIVPSTFSDKGYTINPPYRRLCFRSKPDQGDELVKFYAASNNIQMEMADRIVTDFVTELRSILHAKKIVVFPGLGRLRATKENNVFFVADEDLDIYPDGFGLEPISLKTNQETAEEVSAAVEGLKSLLEETAPVAATEVDDLVAADMPVANEAGTSEPAMEDPVAAEEPVTEESVAEVSVVEEPVEDTPATLAEEPIAASEAPAEVAEGPASVLEVKSKRRIWRKLMWTMIILLILAVVLFIAFVVISRTNPQLLDNILYSKEELEIINHKL